MADTVADGGRYPLSATLYKQQMCGARTFYLVRYMKVHTAYARTPVPRQETGVSHIGNWNFRVGKLEFLRRETDKHVMPFVFPKG